MTVTLSFMEVVTLIGMLLAGVFTILKMSGSQFLKSIGSKFTEIDADMKKQSADLNKSIDDKFSSVMLSTQERIKLERMEIELVAEKRHSAYLEKFSTKDDLVTISVKHDKRMDEIFEMLRSIESKIANTVSREEFSNFKAGQ